MANEHYGMVNTASTSPKNFFAGDFPTVTDAGTAGGDIAEYAPVMKDDSGNIVTITAEKKDDVIGIAAHAAGQDEPIVYYQTGEFFADALAMPEGVKSGDIVDALRKVSIFLRGDIETTATATTEG